MKRNYFDLDNKTAIITGAGRGIGKSIALGLAEYGANIVICSRNQIELNQVAKEASGFDGKALVVQADISRMEGLDRIVSESKQLTGKIDILVNNAGAMLETSALEAKESDWDIVMDTNVKAPFFLSQKIAKIMIAEGRGGSIINITSEVTDKVEVNLGAYCPSKAALQNVTKVLAREWGRHKIRVNCIAPCFVDTVLNQPLFQKKDQFYTPKLKGVPIGRHSVPEDLKGAAIFLASEASSYITGTTILIDGGYTT
jgi:2-dehydro-3-deoxy-D-gluconate 5-dehydrogenase